MITEAEIARHTPIRKVEIMNQNHELCRWFSVARRHYLTELGRGRLRPTHGPYLGCRDLFTQVEELTPDEIESLLGPPLDLSAFFAAVATKRATWRTEYNFLSYLDVLTKDAEPSRRGSRRVISLRSPD